MSRKLEELSHAELVEMCFGLILDNARLNGQIAWWYAATRGLPVQQPDVIPIVKQ